MNKIIEKAVNEIHQAKEEFFKMGYAIYEIFMPDFVIEEFKKISFVPITEGDNKTKTFEGIPVEKTNYPEIQYVVHKK